MVNDSELGNPIVACEQHGREARRDRQGLDDNPYRRSENMPGTTGELHLAWQAKAQAWERGWHDEDQRERATEGTSFLHVAHRPEPPGRRPRA